MSHTSTSQQTIYKSRYEHPPLPPQTSVFHYLFPPAAVEHLYAHSRFPDHLPAFIDPLTDRTTTRRELRLIALRLSLGLRKDPRLQRTNDHTPVVMLFSQNSLDYPNVLFGAQAAGIVTTLANSGYTPTELAHQIRDSTAQMIFAHPALLPVVEGALEHLRKEGHYNNQAKPDVLMMVRNQDIPINLKSSGIKSYEHLMVSEEEVKMQRWEGMALNETQSNEAAFLCYSSGTTGLSKGVETTHYNMASLCEMVKPAYIKLSPEENDKIVGVLPMYHIYGLQILLCLPLTDGVPVITHAKFDPEQFLASIQQYKATWALVVPPILVVLANSPIVDKYDLSSMKGMLSGAAPLGEGLIRKVMDRLGHGFQVTQGYGLTETTAVCHCNPLDDCLRKIGSIGVPVPHITARIVDSDMKDVPAGQPGELLLKGPSVMRGYWRNKKAKEGTFTSDGWYKTGDVAQIDDEGYFYVVDRLKELIKYKGFQVPPADLEALLLTHPKVADAGVCGINDPAQATELPRAYIVPVDGLKSLKTDEEKSRFAKEIIEWVQGKVANQKRLRDGVVLVEAIPKSAAGKILRRELRAMAAKEVENPDKVTGVKAKL